MRRKDREIKDIGEIVEIIKKNEVLRLGLCDGKQPYIVPLNYGYEFDGASVTFYMHCAKEGRKLDIINNNSNGCIEIEGHYQVLTAEEACQYSCEYESVIASGKIEIVTSVDEKISALKILMKQISGKDFDFNEKMANSITILKLKSDEITGKRLRRPV